MSANTSRRSSARLLAHLTIDATAAPLPLQAFLSAAAPFGFPSQWPRLARRFRATARTSRVHWAAVPPQRAQELRPNSNLAVPNTTLRIDERVRYEALHFSLSWKVGVALRPHAGDDRVNPGKAGFCSALG